MDLMQMLTVTEAWSVIQSDLRSKAGTRMHSRKRGDHERGANCLTNSTQVVRLFLQHLLMVTCYVPAAFLDAGDTSVNKTDKIPALEDIIVSQPTNQVND